MDVEIFDGSDGGSGGGRPEAPKETEAQVKEREHKESAANCKRDNVPAEKALEHHTPEAAYHAGYSITDLHNAHVKFDTLEAIAGIDVVINELGIDKVKNEIGVKNLVEKVGVEGARRCSTVDEMYRDGVPVDVMYREGVKVEEFHQAKVPASELYNAGVPASEMRGGGYSTAEQMGSFLTTPKGAEIMKKMQEQNKKLNENLEKISEKGLWKGLGWAAKNYLGNVPGLIIRAIEPTPLGDGTLTEEEKTNIEEPNEMQLP